ncbi:MAG: hypothetical protein JXQ75_14610 [Phycisphaerae bacterium]|nr:hypothetical protein [Phycisphaerae bacterium]
MKAFLARSYIRVLPLCLLLMMAGCDDDEWSSGDVTDIVYAVGDVVLAILQMVLWL